MKSERQGGNVFPHCFSPGWRETGTRPQGRSLPRGPPWNWSKAVKRRRSQATPVTVTLRVKSQHCDSLIHTYLLILTCLAQEPGTCHAGLPKAERQRGSVQMLCCTWGEMFLLESRAWIRCWFLFSAEFRHRSWSLCWTAPVTSFVFSCSCCLYTLHVRYLTKILGIPWSKMCIEMGPDGGWVFSPLFLETGEFCLSFLRRPKHLKPYV